MQSCPECGNHDMQVLRSDAGPVYECGLCGARFGDRVAVTGHEDRDEAAERGIDHEVWPLARALEGLPGFALGATSGGGRGAGRNDLPYVELLVTGPDALAQIENIAKCLRLSSTRLRCRWHIEVTFEHTLQFVIGLRDGSDLRDSRIDIERLSTAIVGNATLSWWQHANEAETG